MSEFGGCIPDAHASLEKAPASSKAEALSLYRRTSLGLNFEELEAPTSREGPSAESRVESTTLRSSAVEAGRQPSFGKRTQMIRDGINDPLRHLKEAMGLKHPFDSTSSVKEDHVRNTIWEKEQVDPNRERLALLSALESLSRDPEVIRRDSELKEGRSCTFKRIGEKLNLGLMERVQALVDIEDKAVPLLCRQGLNITGKASCSPFFLEFEEPQKVKESEFLSTSKRRAPLAIKKTEFMARQGGEDMAQAIWSKVLGEIHDGSLGTGMTLDEARSIHGSHCNVVPSFGLKQGVNSKGQPKFRRIDDHTSGWVNLAAKRMQKIPMANTDAIAALVKHTADYFQGTEVLVATADMQAAYRQVPLDPEDVPRALTAIFNPHEGKAMVHEVYAQPFGAGHAVPNFYRLAEWFARFLMRYFKIQCDHFFDDFWIVSKANTAEISLHCMLQSAKLLGIRFDPDKTQLPSPESEVLGVVFDTRSLASKNSFSVKAKPSRAKNLSDIIQGVLDKGVLTPNMAASIVGKFGFLCSTLFGKVGRFASLGVRHREHSTSQNMGITPNLETSLKLMSEFVQICKPREIKLSTPLAPLLLYTDASDVPEREPRFIIGGVLIDQRSSSPLISHFHWTVPQSMVDRWIPKQTYMGQLELLAGPVALSTWADSLTESKCIHFVDNDAASASLVKGYSPKSDSCEIAGAYWLQAALTSSDIYIDRVESKSNLSDGPSRLDFALLDSLGSIPVSPIVPDFLTSDEPSRWLSKDNSFHGFATSQKE